MSTITKKTITDRTLIPIINICRGSAGYTVNNGNVNIRRNWAATGVVQEIEFGELKIVINEPGVRQQFEEWNPELRKYTVSALLVKNVEVREKLGLIPLDDYVLDKDQVKNLLLNDSIEKLEDVLINCSQVVLDVIVQLAIELSISDMNKITLIKEYSGKDIVAIIQDQKEQKVESKRGSGNNQQKANTNTRSKK